MLLLRKTLLPFRLPLSSPALPPAGNRANPSISLPIQSINLIANPILNLIANPIAPILVFGVL